MVRISTIFIAICMVLVAASLGMVLYSTAAFSATESAIVALTTLTFIVLYNSVAARLRDRSDVGSQVADLSRGTAELAHQIAEFGRRLAAIEGKVVSANSANHDRVQAALNEIDELGGLVKQLAVSVANHEEMLEAGIPAAKPAAAEPDRPAQASEAIAAPSVGQPVTTAATTAAAPAPAQRDAAQLLAIIRNAVEANRIDIYLQPTVTLPQRKVRFYEAVTRLRDDGNLVVTADEFIPTAQSAGLMGQIDHAVMLRCMQVLRRLMVRNKEVGVFCNVAATTLADPDGFAQCLDFLEANRALASSFVLEFKQSMFRNLGPAEVEHLAALAQRGYRFSIDHVTDLRIDPRELADRGVRYIKVPAMLLLDPREYPASDIHPADLSDLLGRFGIDLIAERIEGERAVVDLLDYDVRFGQGFLFAAPRPLRPEAAPASAAAPNISQPDSRAPHHDAGKPPQIEFSREAGRIDPPRLTGNAALARRASGPG
ncbi:MULTISPECIES: EAL domain-containing protein [Rhodopseudomonas]|uniref:Diguanylate phosphodiesterase n=1 Tax=Rhodopseudomonas palustris TaxID=1076 RepID=A0A0D7EI54_RHOPL|nr:MULTISPECIES: EAL domain-containing protein [Rhodopseudomonas]KIZ40180.1 diguanylate phosphodiesterase [Rhodopseudomonas palustris]MDF3811177.1 EAL domain-containing protein [Rhodopseudomonas sp. BAL398]WOK17459.1 EAL domain-containing protein [Rhodopseudomonas sp. BAL398]